MNETLEYFCKKFNLDLNQPSPITLSYSRFSFLNDFKDLNLKVGAEIGTESGYYASKLLSINPQVKLYCIDSYKAIPYYKNYVKQEEVDSYYEKAKSRLNNYNHEFILKTSMEAVKDFEYNTLDFVFIDADHRFEFVINDLIYWSRIVKPGGIVYGHDFTEDFQVREAVKAYTDVYKINPWFILHRNGRLVDSWLFVRQKEDQIWI